MKFSRKMEACSLSPIRKFRPSLVEAESRGIRVHHLNIGQPDVETPSVFLDAIRSYRDSVVPYGPTSGMDRFLKAVQGYYRNIGVELQEQDILTTYGGSEALQIIFSCILDDGDEILVPEPFYPNYATFIQIAGGKICPVHTSAQENYCYARRERIEPLINERTRAILITNPNNPTGVVLTAEERQVLVDIAREHDLFLISDEVYREVIYGGEPVSTMLAYEEAAENVIVVDSVSKRFSATGARVGMMISRNRELMGQAMKFCQSRLCAATLDQIGSAAMYETLGEEYFESIRQEYARRRDAVTESLAKIPGVAYQIPNGAFYLMVTLPVDDAEKLQYFLLEEFSDNGETVMYAPGEGFYAQPGKGRNEIRIAYVTNPEELRRSVELLGLGIAAYNAGKD